MTVKERLHHLLDALPESDLPHVARVLDALAATTDPVLRAHLSAPLDDEPDTDDFDGGLTEARAQMRAGNGIPHEEVKRELGLA